MSRESDYRSLIDLKAKLEAVDCADEAADRAKDNLDSLIRESERISLTAPVKPLLNSDASSKYQLKHSETLYKRYKVFVWFVFILFSLIILAGGYQLFELAQMNINTMHTTFGVWLSDKFGSFDLSDKILMYIAAVALAVINLICCGAAVSED